MDDAGGVVVRYVPPMRGRAIWWLGGRGVFPITGEETGGAFCWWQDMSPPDGGPAPHVHSREEEFFYILAGDLVYEVGGHRHQVGSGSLVCLPKGIPHRFRNGPTWARLIVFVAPAGNERFFLELAADDTSEADPTVEPDPARFREVSERHGVTLIPPDALDWEARGLPVGEGRTPFVRRPGEGERLAWPGAVGLLKATGAETDGAYTLAEITLDPGASLPGWATAGHCVGIYILEGTPTIRLGDRSIRTSEGGTAVLPGHVTYGLDNDGRSPARLLWISAPAGVENALRGRSTTDEGRHADGR